MNRNEIATECGFGKSALQQNPAIREALRAEVQTLRAALQRYAVLEDVLAETGRLPR